MPKSDVETFQLQYDTWKKDRLIGLSGVKPFEFFCADQFLKERLLSDAEILSGQVDASDDGGVDGFYCFLNRTLLDDTIAVQPRAGGDVELKIFQCRENAGFSPTSIVKFGVFIADLLALSKSPAEYHYTYHNKLTELMGLFKSTMNQLRKYSLPSLSIEFFYITKFDVEPNRNSKAAAVKLRDETKSLYGDATVEPVRFINVGQLWSQFQVRPPKKKAIRLIKSVDTTGGWIGIATLKDYYEFLKDSKPGLNGQPQQDEHMFDSNVRGYQLNARVNRRITNTLEAFDKPVARRPPNFWQLNNGITILSPHASLADGLLTVDNPQVVNGLQTSRRIFDYCSNRAPLPDSDERQILIRVIKTADEFTRSEIIRATNDQNPMPGEAFLSTLRVQHQIEQYFESKGLFL